MPAESYYAIGRWANMLRDTSQLTVSSENADFPKSELVVREPGREFRFAAAAADDAVTADLSVFLDGGFELWSGGAPVHGEDASNGTGAVEQETGGQQRTGSSGLRLNGGGGGNEAVYRQRFKVMGGWSGTVEGYIKSNDASPVIVRIRLLETGQWLNSSGAWVSSQTNFASDSSSGYVQKTASIAIPEASVSLYPTMTVEVEIRYEGTGLGFADDFGVWFAWDLAALLGHNLDTATITPRFERSTDGAAFSTEVDATIAVPSFYVTRSTPVTARYLRLKAVGTNHEALRYGELFVTRRRSHAVVQKGDYIIAPRIEALERAGFAGKVERIVKAEHAALDHVLRFAELSPAQFDELYDNILRAGEWGAAPGIVVPDSRRSEVIHATFGTPQIQREETPANDYVVTIPFEASSYAIRTR